MDADRINLYGSGLDSLIWIRTGYSYMDSDRIHLHWSGPDTLIWIRSGYFHMDPDLIHWYGSVSDTPYGSGPNSLIRIRIEYTLVFKCHFNFLVFTNKTINTNIKSDKDLWLCSLLLRWPWAHLQMTIMF